MGVLVVFYYIYIHCLDWNEHELIKVYYYGDYAGNRQRFC